MILIWEMLIDWIPIKVLVSHLGAVSRLKRSIYSVGVDTSTPTVVGLSTSDNPKNCWLGLNMVAQQNCSQTLADKPRQSSYPYIDVLAHWQVKSKLVQNDSLTFKLCRSLTTMETDWLKVPLVGCSGKHLHHLLIALSFCS